MRQAGIIAAAGIVALDSMVERIRDDHDNAAHLARGIAGMSRLAVDLASVQTNIVYFDVVGEGLSAETLVSHLVERGVKMISSGPGRIRAVTHYGIDRSDIDTTLSALGDALGAS